MHRTTTEYASNKRIVIYQPYTEARGNKTRIATDVSIAAKKTTLWYELDTQYASWVNLETADTQLVALLIFAMINNLDIVIDGTVSEKIVLQCHTLLP